MSAGTFNQVFSAATVAFTQKTELYHQLYSLYMGTRQDPPAFTNVDFPWPNEDAATATKPFQTGKLKIGTYERSPYNYFPEGSEERTGFEVDFTKAIVNEINNHYPNLPNIEEEWVNVPIDDSELFWDGTEPLVISSNLKEGLGTEYDMILSGCLVGLSAFDTSESDEESDQGEKPGQPCFNCGQDMPPPDPDADAGPVTAYCAPYSNFHVGICYCGDKALERVPEPDPIIVYNVLGNFSKEEGRKLLVTHTNSLSDPSRANNSTQSQTAAEVIGNIMKYGGQAESQPRLVWGILDGIRASTVDIYVGDGIQIQVMNANRNRDEFAHVVDLGLKWSEMYIAPMTLADW